MEQYVFSGKDGFTDISPITAGYHSCDTGYTFGPYVRDHYLIHFVVSGKGRLTDKYGTHEVGAGELFIIRPGEVTVYKADERDPWDYRWIGFKGECASRFDSGGSVYRIPDGMTERIDSLICSERLLPEMYVAFLFELSCRLFSQEPEQRPSDRLHKLRRYIRYNYMEPLRVEALARAAGLERSYLFRSFKARYGVSVKEYIISVRMKEAARFLSEGYSVSESAYLVGYDDPSAFSRAFKSYHGVSPSARMKSTVLRNRKNFAPVIDNFKE